jgi:hypothetical protein
MWIMCTVPLLYAQFVVQYGTSTLHREYLKIKNTYALRGHMYILYCAEACIKFVETQFRRRSCGFGLAICDRRNQPNHESTEFESGCQTIKAIVVYHRPRDSSLTTLGT